MFLRLGRRNERRLAESLWLSILAGPSPAAASEFRNGNPRFELPAGWTCGVEETKFVCEPPHVEGQPVSATMILTAKVPGPDDGIAEYKRYLEDGPPSSAEMARYDLPPTRPSRARSGWTRR